MTRYVGTLRTDVANYLPEASPLLRDMAERNAEVFILGVVRLELLLDVIPHCIPFVPHPSARLQPLLTFWMTRYVATFTTDGVHDVPEASPLLRDMVLRNAEVFILVVVRLELLLEFRPHPHTARLYTLPSCLRVPLSTLSKIESLLALPILILENPSICRNVILFTFVCPLHRFDTRKTLCLQNGHCECVCTKDSDCPMQSQILWVSRRVGNVILRSYTQRLFNRGRTATDNLSNIHDAVQVMIRVNPVEAPFVNHTMHTRRLHGALPFRRWKQ